MSDTIHKRFTVSASGAPALVVCLQLDQDQASSLLEWYNSHEKELKAEKWKSWGPAEMALRTLCVQIEHYGPAAFRRVPTLFDESLPQSLCCSCAQADVSCPIYPQEKTGCVEYGRDRAWNRELGNGGNDGR